MDVNVNDRKLVQLLSYLASKNKSKHINKLKAIKLVWAADRYHLRKYGRLVSADEYYAMKYGPVGSQLKNIAELDNFLPDSYIEYSKKFITPSKSKITITTNRKPDEDLLSVTDIEALEFAWDNFGLKTGFAIADISHGYPEWLRFKQVLESGQVSRERIDPLDFFKNPSDCEEDVFEMDEHILVGSKRIFEQNTKLRKALTL